MIKDIKKLLDDLVKEYETPDFIPDDPVKFPHMFDNPKDQEVVALIASSLAYGRRENILTNVQKIIDIMKSSPYDFVSNFNFKKDSRLFENFIHRYTMGKDVSLLILALQETFKEYSSLKEAFLCGYSADDINIKQALTGFVRILRRSFEHMDDIRGACFLIPSPEGGSACKRLNMFLRWMVRPGPVDLRLWSEIPTSKLIIPLDTHVARLSRKLHLTNRKIDDWKTAEDITNHLSELDPADPVKYDFAIFGMGIAGKDLQ